MIVKSSRTARFSCFLACFTAATTFLSSESVEAQVSESDKLIVEKIDQSIRQSWEENEVKPSPRASDEEFARRVSLDIVGHLPPFGTLMDFLEDESRDKRLQFVDTLLADPNYIKYWTNIWGNILVGRSRNRANLDRWLRNAFYENMPYNKFVHELVSAEGLSTENGAVNFLSNHLNEGAVPATAITSRIFLGMQVQCTQCHNHPFNDWQQSQFWSMNAFFRGTRRQNGSERGQFYLYDDPNTGLVYYEKRNGLQQATLRKFVDGTMVSRTEDDLPRQQLADLITDPEKPFMTRTEVNRMWGHFFGFGFTRPIDDMGPHNPPSHPELIDFLAAEFQKSGYDLKRLIRWIAASEAYNLTSRFNESNLDDNPSAGSTPVFSRMYSKQFSAEQLYDSLIIVTEAHKGSGRDTTAAEAQRQTWLRQFVQAFGTDENDESTTFNGTIPQALLMMNGQLIANALDGSEGAFLERVLMAPGGDLRQTSQYASTSTKSKSKSSKKRRTTSRKLSSRAKSRLIQSRAKNMPEKIETLFLVALSRKPTESELEAFNTLFKDSGSKDPVSGLQDVFWALLNSNEFIINH